MTDKILSSPQRLPISFIYDGVKINGFPDAWDIKTEKRCVDAGVTETVYEGTDPKTRLNLRVECAQYANHPVVEWVVWLENKGDTPTPIISDILAFDGNIYRYAETFSAYRDGADMGKDRPILQYCNGDTGNMDLYAQKEVTLGDDAILFAPEDGRSTDHAFPYFRLRLHKQWLALAIGWPAQWNASFIATKNAVHIKAGQERTHMRLMPGETIRTPRITLLFWEGDTYVRGLNLWREWYRLHILKKIDGKPLQPKTAASCNGSGNEFVEATEKNQLEFIDLAEKKDLGVDIWWIDAGWYGCEGEWDRLPVWWTEEAKAQGIEHKYGKHWWFTGTWEPDGTRFPNGLKPVSDRAAKMGADLLIWFEPERVFADSKLDREHPEWLLKLKSAPDEKMKAYRLENNHLLNLGNPECCGWLTDHISGLISDGGIKVYRQDFNFPPLQYWRDNDCPDRQGISENLYVQGLLRFWDGLLARHPNLWIDSCAAGGRRCDLETMRRAVPLIYSDFGLANNRVKLTAHHVLAGWIPYFMHINACDDEGVNGLDRYTFHCSMAPVLHLAVDIQQKQREGSSDGGYDFDGLKTMIGIWHKAARYITYGDYYPHTPPDMDSTGYILRQYHDPKTCSGFVQCITRKDYAANEITIRPFAIADGMEYCFVCAETNRSFKRCGRDLDREGFTTMIFPRDAYIWFYEGIYET